MYVCVVHMIQSHRLTIGTMVRPSTNTCVPLLHIFRQLHHVCRLSMVAE